MHKILHAQRCESRVVLARPCGAARMDWNTTYLERATRALARDRCQLADPGPMQYLRRLSCELRARQADHRVAVRMRWRVSFRLR